MPLLCSMLGTVARMNTMDWMKPVQCCELTGLNRSLRIQSAGMCITCTALYYIATGVCTAGP